MKPRTYRSMSPQAEAIENQFRLMRVDAGGVFDLSAERNNTKDAHELTGVPASCKLERGKCAEVPILRMMPDNDQGRFKVIFLHGGAFCLMSAWTHHRFAGHIAVACKNQVIVPDYSLAPEHPFPSALNECVAVIAASQQAGDRLPAALVGESAGGGLALSSLLAMRDRDMQMPFAAVLMAPWLDLTLDSPSVRKAAEIDVILTEDKLKANADLYVGSASAADPLVSPLFGSFDGLPPLYVQSSGKDLLRDDSRRLQEAFGLQGIEIRHDFHADMLHSFQFFAGRMPEADKAIDSCAEFLQQALPDHRDRSSGRNR